MSVGGSFKQKCPTCEALVLIRDPKWIGKQIECPKCKDKFKVEKPAGKSDASIPKKPAAKRPPVEDEDEDAPKAKPKTKKKPIEKDPDDDAPAEGTKKKKKKKGGLDLSNKKTLGLILAGLGLVILAVAGWFVIQGRGSDPKSYVRPPSVPFKGKGKGAEDEEKKEAEPKKKEDTPKVVPIELVAAGPEFTNLLPPTCERVTRVHFKNLWSTVFNDIALQTAGTFSEADLKKRLGFSVTNIDDWLRGEKFSGGGWTFTAVHVMEPLDLKALTTALGLKPAGAAIKNQDYFLVGQAGPFLDLLHRNTLGLSPALRLALAKKAEGKLYFRLHDRQTMIFAEEEPMLTFLQAEGKFPIQGQKKDSNNEKPAEEKKDDTENLFTPERFSSIKPALKAYFDAWAEKLDEKDKVLFSTAQDAPPAQVRVGLPEYRDTLLYQPGPLWDLTLILEERRSRIQSMGTVLWQKATRSYSYRTEFRCGAEIEARELNQELVTKVSPRVAGFVKDVLGTEVRLPKLDVGAVAIAGDDKKDVSKIVVEHEAATVSWQLDLLMDSEALGRAVNLVSLLVMDARSRLTMLDQRSGRSELAQAANRMAQQGIPGRFPAGAFPPGAFKRATQVQRTGQQPGNRISWMSALLPFLGQDSLFQKIDFEASWRDPVNWPAGQTLVPQFLDSSYPENAFHTRYGSVPVDLGATHFVGIAGVGMEAADLSRDSKKAGILGYEGSDSLKQVQDGHGLSNTILMIQVPHDGVTGVSPWIAGGGSTLRGVPETKSIEPFVLSVDRDGRTIQHKGRAGTYALMADGSVRFLAKNISDPVMKAMSTVSGPVPEGLDWGKLDEATPIAPAKGP